MRKVALIVLDCVRKDHFDKNSTRLKELADLDVDECYSASSWSVPSHSSLFTGLLPHQHGVHSYNTDYSELDTFFEDVHSEGISANGAVSDTFNADDLFDEFVSFSGKQEMIPDAVTFKDVAEYDEGLGRILEYLKRGRRDGKLKESLLNGLSMKLNHWLKWKPFYPIGDHGASEVTSRLRDSDAEFVFCNYIDAHAPMQNLRVLNSKIDKSWHSNTIPVEDIRSGNGTAESEDLSNYLELYDETIQYLDKIIASFAEDLPDDMSLIITADHGEELLYDGEPDLGHTGFSQSLLHVPFIIINADVSYDGGMVSHLDVPEIVRQLWDSKTIDVPTRPIVPSERPGMMFYDGEDPWWNRAVRAVTKDAKRWQWDELGESHLIELGTSKENNQQETEIPEEYHSIFDLPITELGKNEQHLEIDREAEKRLEELGYKI